MKSYLVYIFYYLIYFNFLKIFDNLILKTLWTLLHCKIYETNIGNEWIVFFFKYDEWVNAIDNFLSSYFITFITAFVIFF